MVFTTLAHHIDIEWLHEAYRRTRKSGAVGVDGQTARDYAANHVVASIQAAARPVPGSAPARVDAVRAGSSESVIRGAVCGNSARTDLRGAGRGNLPGLPDIDPQRAIKRLLTD
jgi:hypothetical protein